jgi:thiamine kinase-like enzyme
MPEINSEIEKKFQALTDEKKTAQILSESEFFVNLPIKQVEISILKSYKDERSYSLSAIYAILFESGQKQELVATANSDGVKEYAWRVSKIIFEKFGNHADIDIAVPEPIGYLENYGLFLREFTPGETLAQIIKREREFKKFYADRLVKWLVNFQKILPAKEIKSGLDFGRIEKNLIILKEREMEIFSLQEQLQIIKEKISEFAKEKSQILVHGDFNPLNVIVSKNKLTLIDFENAHLGDELIDIANFMSHLATLEDLNLDSRQRANSCDALIQSYESKKGALGQEEKKKIDLYRGYFNLLVKTHKLVWD